MSKKACRSFTADQKAAIVRRHLVDKVPVSNLCDEYGIQPSMFYNWQKVLVDSAARAFEPEGGERVRPSREAELEQKVAQLEGGQDLAKREPEVDGPPARASGAALRIRALRLPRSTGRPSLVGLALDYSTGPSLRSTPSEA